MDQMKPAQAQREKLLAYRRELYREHPEAEAFRQAKSRWLKLAMLFCLAISVLKMYLLGQTGLVSLAGMVLGSVIWLGTQLIFLAAGMGDRQKLAWVLYLWGVYQLYQRVSPLWKAGYRSLGAVIQSYSEALGTAPLYVLADLLSMLYVFLILGTAVWLTLPEKSRRLAAEIEPLEEQWRAFLQAESGKKQ